MYFIFYQSVMGLSLAMSIFLLGLSWQRRQFPAAPSVAALATATFVWTLGFLLEANSATLERQLFFNNVGYLGTMSVPLAWFVFALQYTSGGKAVNRRRLAVLAIVPVVTIILVWTNEWHHLMWSNERLVTSGSFLVTAKTYGTFFWVALVYNYVVVLAGSTVLVRRLFVGAPLYKAQAVSLLFAVILPLVWNLIYVFKLLAIPRKDLTPAMFAFSITAVALGLLRFRLLAVVPFARKFVVEQLSEGVLVFDSDDNLLEANPAALKAIGAHHDIVGKRLAHLVASSAVFAQISSNKSGRVEFPLRVNGENCFYELETVPMRDNQGRQVGRIATMRDITERKNMQAQIMAQDRLASIGHLAAGVAHEINNPMTPVIGFADLLLKKDLPDDVRNDVKAIHENAKRTASVVERLLAFARQTEPVRALCSIDDVVDSALQLTSNQLENHGIQVIKQFTPGIQQTFADCIQLEQVFLNLILNADYEMSNFCKGGTLIIKIDNPAGIIRVSVKDNGRGISKENMNRLFTPFFTTKPVGEGTGLGLSICHGIVTGHGGRIFAESEDSKGATFTVELPVVASGAGN